MVSVWHFVLLKDFVGPDLNSRLTSWYQGLRPLPEIGPGRCDNPFICCGVWASRGDRPRLRAKVDPADRSVSFQGVAPKALCAGAEGAKQGHNKQLDM